MTNLQVTEAVAPHGFYYAPDPSSQQVCTIGGNVAENSGGAHCLKYGFTVNHVTGLVVVPPGRRARAARRHGPGPPGPDLLGVFVGSEGTLGIATEITLRVLRRPEAVVTLLAAFDSTDEAGGAVSGIVAARILPAAIEMMDRLTIEAAEAAVHAGYPEGAGAVLIVELDGVGRRRSRTTSPTVERDLRARAEPGRSGSRPTTRSARCSGRAASRPSRPWAASATNYYVQDGVVPRTKLPEVLRRIAELEREYGLRVGNVFHAGDGNLHPLVLYDERVEGEAERARAARRGDPRGLRRRRRVDHRRARHRHRQGVLDAAHVRRRRPRGDAAVAPRLRPGRARQPGQDVPDAAPVRRGARARTGQHPLEKAGLAERL